MRNKMTEMDLINDGLAKYEQALEAGMSRTEAKQYAYSEIPELRKIIEERGWLTHWGNGIKAINISRDLTPQREKKPAPPPMLDFSDDTPKENNSTGLVRTSTGKLAITKTVLAALEHTRPAVGDEVCMGNLEMWGHILGVTPEALSWLFRHYTARPSAAERAGWRFEIVNPSRHQFTVRVVAAPKAPPPVDEKTYTSAEVQALFAEFMAQHKTRGKK